MLPLPRVRGEGLGVRAPTLPRPASKRRLAAFALTGGLCVHTILQLVSPDSLPYTVLILLVELAVGSLATVTLFDARRMVTMGYVQMGALIVVCSALLALWTVSGRVPTAEVDGYLLDVAWIGPLKVLLLVFSAVSGVHTAAAFADQRRVTMMLGVAGSVLGLVLVGLLAGLVGASAWSYVGVLASMLGAALALGGSIMAMSWGHWYLTNSGLPKEPLEQMSLLLCVALLLQVVFMVLGIAFPPREVPLGEAGFGVALVANPAFWLRVGVGVLFPFALAVLSWRAANIRGMMTATGLLYIATGCILAGEVLARGLLFATGAVV